MSFEQIMAFPLTTDQKHQEKTGTTFRVTPKEQQRADTVRRAM
ncbi:MAG: hypothetical protein WA864_01695 [Acetobacteraceae bacterium]